MNIMTKLFINEICFFGIIYWELGDQFIWLRKSNKKKGAVC